MGYAERKVTEAAEQVCWTLLPDLIERAERARASYLDAKGVLALVARDFDGVHRNYHTPENPLAVRIRSLVLFEPSFSEVRAAAEATGGPWHAALKALCIDADAPLPNLGE